MPTSSLEGVHLKLDRADFHLATLRDQIAEWMRGDPESVERSGGTTSNFDGKRGRWTLSARLPVEPPIDWGVIIGDCLHNVRSALDLLAWQLVIDNDGEPTRQTSFPVFVDKSKFKSSAWRALKGMSRDSRALITKLQPFNTGQKEPADAHLWILHELDVIDKHRVLHPTAMWLFTNKTRLFRADGREIYPVEFIKRGRLEDGTVLARYTWLPWSVPQDEEMEMQYNFSFDVAFEKGAEVGPEFPHIEGIPVLGWLESMIQMVRHEFVLMFTNLCFKHLDQPPNGG